MYHLAFVPLETRGVGRAPKGPPTPGFQCAEFVWSSQPLLLRLHCPTHMLWLEYQHRYEINNE